MHENPRTSPEYIQECLEMVGLADPPDLDKYGHLEAQDIPFLRECVSRGTSCMWLPDSPRTSVRGFTHTIMKKNGEKILTFEFGYIWIQTQFSMIKLGLDQDQVLIPNFQVQLDARLVQGKKC